MGCIPASRERKPLRWSRRSRMPLGPAKSSEATLTGKSRVNRLRKNSRLAVIGVIEAPGLETGAESVAQGSLVQAAPVRPELDEVTLRPAIHPQLYLEFGMAHL